MENKSGVIHITALGALAILAIGLIIVVGLTQQKTIDQKTSAATGTISLIPSVHRATMTTPANIKVFVDTQNAKTAFVKAQVTFDKTKLVVSTEIKATNPNLTTVIKKSSKDQANAEGSIEIVVALPPDKLASAPAGSFDVAEISFVAKTTEKNVTTPVAVTSSSQVTLFEPGKNDAIALVFTPYGSTILLNAEAAFTAPPEAGATPIPGDPSLPAVERWWNSLPRLAKEWVRWFYQIFAGQ